MFAVAALSASILAAATARKFAFAEILKCRVPGHRQIGTVELQLQPAGRNGLIFGAHGHHQIGQVGIVARVVGVGLEGGDQARRGRIHKPLQFVAGHGPGEDDGCLHGRVPD